MKFYNSQRIGEPYKSWKAETNYTNIVIAKNVLNDNITGDINNNKCIISSTCQLKSKHNFNANPIKHYRKQYIANTFSNSSILNTFDKPGSYIVKNTDSDTNCFSCNDNNAMNLQINLINNIDSRNIDSNSWKYDSSLNRMICTGCSPQTMIIKSSSTNLDKQYSSSYKQLLQKKCKTFSQNLPTNVNTSDIKDGTMINCKDGTSCKITFNPSNKRYQTQGPVTSSTRIASLKYGCPDKLTHSYNCNIGKTDFNNPNYIPAGMTREEFISKKSILSGPACVGCPNQPNSIRRKRINIMK